MTLRHLQVFIAVVDAGSMTGAAQQLYISQPSVSQTIGELEAFYQVKLFERLSRKLYLTPEGRQLLGYARHIVSLFGEMEQELNWAQTSSILKVGASITIGTCLLSQLARAFSREYPQLQIQAVVDNTKVIEELVLKSQLDFGLVEGQLHSNDLVAEPLMEDELILVAGKEHPLRAKEALTTAELAEAPLIVREEGSGTRELLENVMFTKGKTLNIVWVCNNSEAIKNAVAAGVGVSVISKLAVARELETKKLYQIPVLGLSLEREFALIYHKNKYLAEPIESFFHFCRQAALKEFKF